MTLPTTSVSLTVFESTRYEGPFQKVLPISSVVPHFSTDQRLVLQIRGSMGDDHLLKLSLLNTGRLAVAKI